MDVTCCGEELGFQHQTVNCLGKHRGTMSWVVKNFRVVPSMKARDLLPGDWEKKKSNCC